jgi:Transglycosylase SLT domain
MGRLARRRRVAAAAGRLGGARRAAALSVAAVVGLTGLGLGGQLVTRGQASQAAVRQAPTTPQAQLAAARVIPQPTAAATTGPASSQPAPAASASPSAQAQSFGRIILPDLLIVAPKGLTGQQITRLGAISGVQNMISFDGAQITAGGRSVSAIGVDPATFRSWVPVRAASDQALWTALSRGEFVAADSAGRRLQLKPGAGYRLSGASSEVVTFGSTARLALNGVDLLVSQAMSRKLGLVHQVAALISAPGVSMTSLTRTVSAILGPTARMESLRSQQLPVAGTTSGTMPTTYLQLFKYSAARECPGLSWAILAAIGQIESGDGTNVGPSTAGALGPMQFLPSTWARWGINGPGQSGPPNVLNPYDAVPSAARLLCADGAAGGGQSLYNAIFAYNHADWYVREVLGLAARYAADYS